MARPIKDTPILFGEDARRFEERMEENRKVSAEELEQIQRNYNIFLHMMQEGQSMQFSRRSI